MGEAGIGKKDQLRSAHSAFTLCSVPERSTRPQLSCFVEFKGEDVEPALFWFCGSTLSLVLQKPSVAIDRTHF